MSWQDILKLREQGHGEATLPPSPWLGLRIETGIPSVKGNAPFKLHMVVFVLMWGSPKEQSL